MRKIYNVDIDHRRDGVYAETGCGSLFGKNFVGIGINRHEAIENLIERIRKCSMHGVLKIRSIKRSA